MNNILGVINNKRNIQLQC